MKVQTRHCLWSLELAGASLDLMLGDISAEHKHYLVQRLWSNMAMTKLTHRVSSGKATQRMVIWQHGKSLMVGLLCPTFLTGLAHVGGALHCCS